MGQRAKAIFFRKYGRYHANFLKIISRQVTLDDRYMRWVVMENSGCLHIQKLTLQKYLAVVKFTTLLQKAQETTVSPFY